MTTIASQITSLTVVYSTVYSDADQRKHQSSASLAFVWGIHRDRWIPRTKTSYAENVSIWWRHHEKSRQNRSIRQKNYATFWWILYWFSICSVLINFHGTNNRRWTAQEGFHNNIYWYKVNWDILKSHRMSVTYGNMGFDVFSGVSGLSF